MKRKLLLGLTSAVAALSSAPQACAQDATTDGATSGGIEEIVVTAQRREESAQRSAISIDTVSADELANVGTNPGDLTRFVPSVQFSQVSNVYPQTSIRGVGNNPLNPSTESTVGFNFDGVPITRTPATVGMYYDLQRVEVLKGPQGTLYGRNNTGGVVNIIPRTPILGETSGNLTFEAGSFDLLRVTGAVNLPLGDQAAVRGAFNVINRDGFYDSGLQDDVGESGRLTLRVEPTPDLTVQVGLDYHNQGGNGGGTTLLNSTFVANAAGPPPFRQYTTDGQPLGGDPWIDVNQRCNGVDSSHVPAPPAAGPNNLDWDDWFYTTGNSPCRFDGRRDDTFWGLTGLVELSLGNGTLTVIPAVRTSELNSLTVGATNLVNAEESDTFTLEARYASDPDERFSYIVGAFLLDDNVDSTYQISIGYPNNAPTLQLLNQTTDSWAVFGSGRFSLTDSLRLTAGVRYTHDEKTFVGTSDPAGPSFLAVSAENSWGEVTYDAGIEWDVAENSLLYLSYGRGYKAGGFFFATPFAGYGPGAPGSAPPVVTGNTFDPEYVTAITLGSKNYFLDRRLMLNLEVFSYQYQDQQTSIFGRDDWLPPASAPGFTERPFLTVNLGEVDIIGAELETQYLLTENTLLSLNVQHLDTEISGTITNAGLNTAGYPTLNAADVTATFGLQQTFPLNSGAEIVADLRGQYRGNIWIGSTDYLPFMEAEPVTTGDFSLSYVSAGGGWRLTGYANNFTDEEVPVFYAGTGEARTSAAGPPSSPFTASYRPPRTYGVRLGMNF